MRRTNRQRDAETLNHKALERNKKYIVIRVYEVRQSVKIVDSVNPIEQTCIDERKMLGARVFAASVAAFFLWANFSVAVALSWFSINIFGEAWSYYATASITENHRGTRAQRFQYVTAVVAMTVNWTHVSVLYWFKYGTGFQIIAVIMLCAQLIHAQAFTFRSLVMLSISGGVPAAALILLTTVFGNASGLEAVTLGVGLVAILAYVMASVHSNLTSQKNLEKVYRELATVAYNDALTGLVNRRGFNEEFDRLIVEDVHLAAGFALILIDLDKFKQINDRYGHDAGDAMLIAAARHLRTAVRHNDILARLGGDEFAVLLPGIDMANDAQAICERIVDEFYMPILFKDILLSSSPSIGFALFPLHGRTPEALLKAADRGLYEAKRDGGNTWKQAMHTIAA